MLMGEHFRRGRGVTSAREPTTASHFKVSPVRHLAWMCEAAQLLKCPLTFAIGEHATTSTWEKLQRWDKRPDTGPAVLSASPPRRLGSYFEALYECMLKDLLGWQVLGRNVVVSSQARTLGELDFIVRNTSTNEVEHHEIAIKFYLGFRQAEDGVTSWYGPNARDRLDLKTARLTQHQSRLAQLPEAGLRLQELGVSVLPKPRIFMPGYLFYPVNESLAPPQSVERGHARGKWRYIDDLAGVDTSCWVPLYKPHWLGPWQQNEPPNASQFEHALERIAKNGGPGLFAVLAKDAGDGLWRERDRVFVVSRQWPLHDNSDDGGVTPN